VIKEWASVVPASSRQRLPARNRHHGRPERSPVGSPSQRAWVSVAAGTALALALFTLWLGLRALAPGLEPGPWQELFSVALLAAAAAGVATRVTRRDHRRSLEQLATQVAGLRENPSLGRLQGL